MEQRKPKPKPRGFDPVAELGEEELEEATCHTKKTRARLRGESALVPTLEKRENNWPWRDRNEKEQSNL